MGTNYYLIRDICKHCGRGEQELHIGKSSYGWCFALHIYPDKYIKTLEDWEKLFKLSNTAIKDEYGRYLKANEMMDCITNRFRKDKEDIPLLRRKIDKRHCVGHGPGTYDYMVGEFS